MTKCFEIEKVYTSDLLIAEVKLYFSASIRTFVDYRYIDLYWCPIKLLKDSIHSASLTALSPRQGDE